MRIGLSLKNESGPLAQPLRDSVATALLLEYARSARPGRNSPHPFPAAIERVKRHIALHYPKPTTLAELVAASQTSRSHLNRLFRKFLGTTPIRYLWQVRLHEGVRLLQDTELSIAEVAERVGYNTPTHFSRVVREVYQRPPSALRRSHRYEGLALALPEAGDG